MYRTFLFEEKAAMVGEILMSVTSLHHSHVCEIHSRKTFILARRKKATQRTYNITHDVEGLARLTILSDTL